MPPAKAETYENLLKYYNRGVFPQVQCECGKIIAQNKLELHKESNIHALLMRYKEQYTKMKKTTTEIQENNDPVGNSYS